MSLIIFLVIGLIAGSACYLMVVEVKKLFGYDDTLDVFGIHGVGGTVGAVATGVFASSLINPIFKEAEGCFPTAGNGIMMMQRMKIRIIGKWESCLTSCIFLTLYCPRLPNQGNEGKRTAKWKV